MSEVEYIAFSSNTQTGYNDENIVFSAYSYEHFIKECRCYIEMYSNFNPLALEMFCTGDLFEILEEMFNISVNYRRLNK